MSFFSCSVCGARCVAFNPINPIFQEVASRHGFIFDFDRFETLNSSSYSCSCCGASDRDRLFVFFLASLDLLNSDLEVLDIAPSIFTQNLFRNFYKKYRSLDLSAAEVDDNYDISERLPYLDGSYDIILFSHVLEHIVEDVKAVTELFRILRNGGVVFVLTPIHLDAVDGISFTETFSDSDRIRLYAQADHYRMYSRDSLSRLFISAGFTFEIHSPDKAAISRLGFSKTTVLYVAKKPNQ